MTTTIGKKHVLNGALVSLLLGLGASCAMAQSPSGVAAGEEMQKWVSGDKPGDGKADVLVQDGNDPQACRLSISVKGGGCTKVMCKGEAPVFTNSVQSKMAAKKIALSTAKAHYVHFLQEEINSKRSTDTINSAIKKEGGADAGTTAASGYVNAESIKEQASALIKGFVVIEDGFAKEGDELVAYTIGGVSCVSQRGADNLSAGNKTNNATSAVGGATAGGGAAVPSRRRAGVDDF